MIPLYYIMILLLEFLFYDSIPLHYDSSIRIFLAIVILIQIQDYFNDNLKTNVFNGSLLIWLPSEAVVCRSSNLCDIIGENKIANWQRNQISN